MWQSLLQYISSNHLGDAASILGIVISVVGFAITLIGVFRSKKAAQLAADAARNMQRTLSQQNTIADFSAAITIMEEIKRYHRVSAWQILPDRYAALRKILVSLRAANPALSIDHRSVLQGAIQQLTDIENIVEKAVASRKNPPSIAKLNEVLSLQIDKLTEVLTTIRCNPKV